jgi:tRNA uridine 5-carboxymethylaminomethyl modification enzyme
MYVNGLSTSLPPAVQLEFLRSIPGLDRVRMTRPGYAIEYDYFPPTQLSPTLEVRAVPGLFLAGQVNGTTGYEEAAGQGVVAGINAAAKALGRDPVTIGRDLAFIGVLVDDLVNRGVDEPYRLFTSRSEYRLLLRQDNALRRLLPLAARLGVLTPEELERAERRLQRENEVLDLAHRSSVPAAVANGVLGDAGSAPTAETQTIACLGKRPGVSIRALFSSLGEGIEPEECEWADIELKYSGYLARERAAAERISKLDSFSLPGSLEYGAFKTLSFEARQKLAAQRPTSLGQARRIPGVSPRDLQSLVLEVLKLRR